MLSLEKLCLPLNSLEPNPRAAWTASRSGARSTVALRVVDDAGRPGTSGLRPEEVVTRLAWFLKERRPLPRDHGAQGVA
jgi:hypothetical protein